MNGPGKSDRPIVPEKPANKGGATRPAEQGEGRGLAKENQLSQNGLRTLSRGDLFSARERVRQAARRDRKLRFTTLWHQVYAVEALREAYFALNRQGAPGVDGVTWREYGDRLEEKLSDLSSRLQRGAYRAKPVERVYIPKTDGKMRPLGKPALEDKIVQRATVDALNAVYETDFLGFSYGFRPGRGQHNALDALAVGISRRKVNWVFDADIRGFFDNLDHEWLIKFVEHRIADRRVARHIQKWLDAGVLEDGAWRRAEVGTPQGGSISPLLANVYLHYVFDLWVEQWRKKRADGEMIVVRYADDFIVGFQERGDAERFRAELTERLAKFKLELHPAKTRLIEFGRFAEENRQARGQGKPETFDFLGFTHICGKTRAGKFKLLRQTAAKKMRAKLQEIKQSLRERMHDPIKQVGEWLGRVLTGHYRYYGVPGNYPAMAAFRRDIIRKWRTALRRRSQKSRMAWEKLLKLAALFLPDPRITHPYPERRLVV